jgi:SAM-dependent methyltransferase
MFPLLYHAHHSQNLEDIPFWLELARSTNGPIIELGCGTGRVFSALIDLGRPVYGLDVDFQMLAFLRGYMAQALEGNAYLIQADFTRFRIAESFGLAIMPCNTYSTLSASARGAALACIRQHLTPGGLFAASVPNPFVLKRLPSHSDGEIDEIFTHPISAEPVQVSSAWHRDQTSFIIQWNYDHLNVDGTIERTSFQIKQIITTTKTYLDELLRANFSSIQIFGDYDRSSYHQEADYLIFLAK